MIQRVASWVCMAAFMVAMYILIMWITTSILITGNGKVKWAEGWDRTVEFLCQFI